jgi:transcriptional regulator with XRE-family HTH domain
MTPSSAKKILAHNVRYFRDARGHSQEELAQLSGVSLRILQDIEKGRANPSLETVAAIADGLKVLHYQLSAMHHLRLLGDEDREHFLAKFRATFETSTFPVGIREVDGPLLWGNETASRVRGHDTSKPSETLPMSLSNETRGVLKAECRAEKYGRAYPYTVAAKNERTGDLSYLRVFPTLIYPKNGKTPLLVALFSCDIEDGIEQHYFDFCVKLLQCVERDAPALTAVGEVGK